MVGHVRVPTSVRLVDAVRGRARRTAPQRYRIVMMIRGGHVSLLLPKIEPTLPPTNCPSNYRKQRVVVHRIYHFRGHVGDGCSRPPEGNIHR